MVYWKKKKSVIFLKLTFLVNVVMFLFYFKRAKAYLITNRLQRRKINCEQTAGANSSKKNFFKLNWREFLYLCLIHLFPSETNKKKIFLIGNLGRRNRTAFVEIWEDWKAVLNIYSISITLSTYSDRNHKQPHNQVSMRLQVGLNLLSYISNKTIGKLERCIQ